MAEKNLRDALRMVVDNRIGEMISISSLSSSSNTTTERKKGGTARQRKMMALKQKENPTMEMDKND